MDEMVLKAMLKWPNVPSCTGWLGLDGRGDWYMRDDQAQASGPFSGSFGGQVACMSSKGSRLQHEALVAFIGRNYARDARGHWYFQNGPQRVFVELTHAPWVWRIPLNGSAKEVVSHTGAAASVQQVLTDEDGLVYLETNLGLGLVHTQDMGLCAERIESGAWELKGSVLFADLPAKFQFERSPAASLP